MRNCYSPLLHQGKIWHVPVTLLVSVLMLFNEAASGQAPTITSFTPDAGPIGATVVISGTNFSTTAANNTVYFGAVAATVTVATTTSLTVAVPTGATWQPITVTTNNLTAFSAKPFTVTFPNGGTNFSASSFASPVDFAPGGTYHRVAVGDLDGDGKIDMAVINEANANVSVFRNTSSAGTVTMAALTNYTTGTNPTDIALGDIDGDGKLDMAISNSLSNSVSVFRNTSSVGTISFALKVDFSSGTNPYGIGIGDLNSDGKPDIAMLNQTSNTLSIFRNTSTVGIISFAARQDFSTGSNPLYLALGDFDGDGKIDVATANSNSSTFSTFRNTTTTSTVTFATRVDVTTGSVPFGISSGDLDGDGKPDLVVVNYSGNTVQLFRNTSTSGTISWATAVSYATNTSYGITIGELDGDGKPDLVVGNYGGNTVSLFHNISSVGTIAYDPKVNYVTWSSPTKSAIADIDGDGKVDVVVAHQSNQHVSVLRNLISGGILPIRLLSFNVSGEKDNISLQWMTGLEHDNRGFAIERSEDTKTYIQIGWLDSKDNSPMGSQYAFVDREVTGGNIYYYRLRQEDLNGSSTLSPTRRAHLRDAGDPEFRLYPNPTDRTLQVQLTVGKGPELVNYSIADAVGTIARTGTLPLQANRVAILDVSDLPGGQYFIRISNGDHLLFTSGFLKN